MPEENKAQHELPIRFRGPMGSAILEGRNNASRAPSAALTAALARARAARREKSLYTWADRTGTIAELAKYSPASERTIRRRLQGGLPVDQAFSLPPQNETPDAGWRTGSRTPQ